MTPRLFVQGPPLVAGGSVSLDEGPARHAQVLRMQPGHPVILFDGRGGEWTASIETMGRREVTARVHGFTAVTRELPIPVTLALGVPANERMDTLVEKATEMGVTAIQPLHCARSVLRLEGERAVRKVAHWQAIAVSAAEQSGRTVVPTVLPITAIKPWLERNDTGGRKALLSFAPGASLWQWLESAGHEEGNKPHEECEALCTLSGPEGGLTSDEEAWARARGWQAVGLGPRVLRADTAPLLALAAVAALVKQK